MIEMPFATARSRPHAHDLWRIIRKLKPVDQIFFASSVPSSGGQSVGGSAIGI